MVLVTWVFDAENPFQSLLLRCAREEGIVPIGMTRLADLDDRYGLPALAALRASERVEIVLHLHWLARVLRGIADESEGLARVKAFVAALDAFRIAGGHIVWTVHNVLPHDTAFPALDRALRVAVIARADVVHVLSEGTVEAAAATYEIPASKVLHVPHPAYLGAYPDAVSDAEARSRYGFGPGDVVFGFVGNIRPYKGLDELLTAFSSLTSQPRPDGRRLRLLIAGMPSQDPDVQEALDRARRMPDAVVDARRIPGEELSIPMRASDVIVLPHRQSLNSGALLLALSFGRPVVAARSPGVTETVGDDAAIVVEPGDAAALGRGLREADRLLTPEARAAAVATAVRYDPDEISRAFVEAIRQRIG